MLGEGRSIRLLRVLGIPIGASPSWFLVLFIFVFLLSDQFQEALGGSETQAYLVALLGAILFFVSLIIHELGHALTARREGIEVEGVDLWFFGGLARLSRDSNTPGEEFRVAGAGPLATALVVAVAFGLLALVVGGAQAAYDVVVLRDSSAGSVAELLLGFLVSMNVFVLIFNLVPAFPLDGGRIARAAAWALTKDKTRATVISAWLGQAFGLLLIGFGAYVAFAREATFNGLWIAFLGWLILSSARQASSGARMGERLELIRVSDVMSPDPATLRADTPVVEADEWLESNGWPWAAVVDEGGHLLGLARRERLRAAIDAGRPALPVREELSSGDGAVRTDEPLQAALGLESLRELGAVMAVDAEGVLRGVLTLDQVSRALTSAGPAR